MQYQNNSMKILKINYIFKHYQIYAIVMIVLFFKDSWWIIAP